MNEADDCLGAVGLEYNIQKIGENERQTWIPYHPSSSLHGEHLDESRFVYPCPQVCGQGEGGFLGSLKLLISEQARASFLFPNFFFWSPGQHRKF